MNLAVLFLLIGLLFVFFQDLKYRHIHIVLPILIFAICFYIFKNNILFQTMILMYNIVFVVLTLALLVFYMSIKNKAFMNPFQNYFGLGDLLFFLAITPLFLTENYILFFVFSMIFSVLMQLIFQKIMKIQTVPLAGFSAVFLVFIIIKDLFFEFNKLTIL